MKNLSAINESKDVVTKESLLDIVYPLGSIYMSVNNVSPQSFLGGTWTRIQDTFLLASGPSYAAGVTGGEAAHKLTVDEMPAHTHQLSMRGGYGEGGNYGGLVDYGYTTNYRDVSVAGGGNSHNNMPPYLTVYMWRRTA